MEKITRSQFIEKYGFDPYEPSKPSVTTGGSTGSSKRNVSNAPQKLSADEVARIRSEGMSSPTKLSAEQVSKIRGTDTGYKPGKFIQALENFRPDYSGGFLSDVSEGIGDFGVGVAKALIRMPVNIVQALTPDAMWGENSLLNSESQRAKAFESATKGKTGLQKAGATITDIASLFAPIGMAKGAATIPQLVGKLTGKGAMLAAGKNTGTLSKLVQKAAPIIGESVAGTAMLGGDAEDIGADAALSIALPVAIKPLYGKMKSVFTGPTAKAMVGEIIGSSKKVQESVDQAIDILAKDPEKKIEVVKKGRELVTSMLSPSFISSKFGNTTDDLNRFNEAADLVMTYYAPKPGPGKTLDWEEGFTQLKRDLDEAGSLKNEAISMLGSVNVNASDILAKTKERLPGSVKKSTGFIKAEQNLSDVMKRILGNKYNKMGSKGILDLEALDTLKNDSWELRRASNNVDEKEVYKQFAEAIDARIKSAAKKSGREQLYNDYVREKAEYSLLKDTEKIMESLANKKNPLYTSQMFDHVFGLASSGWLSDAASGSALTPGVAYAAMRLLSKLAGKTLGDMRLRSFRADPYREAMRQTTAQTKEQSRKGLVELIEKQKANKAKK